MLVTHYSKMVLMYNHRVLSIRLSRFGQKYQDSPTLLKRNNLPVFANYKPNIQYD